MTAEAESNASSRRAVLAAGVGGVLALVAQALGRPSAARATNGDPLTAGSVVSATSTTGATTSGGNGLQGVSSDGNASGVYGESNATTAGHGVAGRATGTSGIAVLADGAGNQATGLWAKGGADGYAIRAKSQFSLAAIRTEGQGIGLQATGWDNHPVVEAQSLGHVTAVLGYSGADAVPIGPAKTGVYGYANQDANATGVFGASGQGLGVRGTSNTSIGVHGASSSNTGVSGSSNSGSGVNGFSNSSAGVSGQSATGTGVWGSSGGSPTSPAKTGVYGYASQDATARGVVGQTIAGRGVHGLASSGVGVRAEATTTGIALDVVGKARFSRSGRLAIAAGRSYVTKTGIPLSSSSVVLAVLQTNRSGIHVRAAVPNPAASSFTIYLNVAVRATTYVGWFVLG